MQFDGERRWLSSPPVHTPFMIACDTALAGRSTGKGAMAMNNRLVFRTLAIAALVLLGAVAIGIGAYNAGWAHGIAENGGVIVAPPAGAPYVYVWPHPWGFGFFPFFPFLFFLVFFVFVRGLLWRGGRH